MKEMKEHLKFIEALSKTLFENVRVHIDNEEKKNCFANLMNKNHGKTALKRKITLLRQELLNLERMIDNA